MVIHKGQNQPTEITAIREPIHLRPLLKVQVKDGRLVVEAIGGQQVSQVHPGKPVTVNPISDTEFFVDGRYHTRIAFTKDGTGKSPVRS